MATVTKDLGIATAYGYAKSKGYTGTEDEFAQAMLDMTTAVDDAQQYAQDAEDAKDDAQASAESIEQSAQQIATNTSDIADLKADLNVLEEGGLVLKDEVIAKNVTDWLDEHPEATTTVEDGSLTDVKFTESLKLKTLKDYVTPEMYGATGDGVTDDTLPFRNAVNSGKLVYCSKKYKITEKIQLKIGIDGYGEIVFAGNGCFTVSIGTKVTGISIRTSNKLLDFTDTDVTSTQLPNAHMMVLFKDIKVYCENGTDTLFDIKSSIYGFFDMVFKNINITGQCDKAVNIIATSPGWITQIMFIDCMFGTPLHVCTVKKADRIHFERCTSQADENNKNNLLYDINDCKMFTIVNCFDWDFPYQSTTKLYKFTDCRECVWIGNDRTINNFDNTISELMQIFATLMIGAGYSPSIYNKANVLNSVMDSTDETFFKNPTGYGLTLAPVRTGKGVGFRFVNSYSLPYGAYSYDFVVNGEGKISIRIRVVDKDSPLDADGNHTTKWGDWKTISPDSN